jgi:hypothetical protein
MAGRDLVAALNALGAAPSSSLSELAFEQTDDVQLLVASMLHWIPGARALAAAALRMARLASLSLRGRLFYGVLEARGIFAHPGLWPRLAHVTVNGSRFEWSMRQLRGTAAVHSPDALQLLVASGLRVDKLCASSIDKVQIRHGRASIMAEIAAAPALAMRTLPLGRCRLGAAELCDRSPPRGRSGTSRSSAATPPARTPPHSWRSRAARACGASPCSSRA